MSPTTRSRTWTLPSTPKPPSIPPPPLLWRQSIFYLLSSQVKFDSIRNLNKWDHVACALGCLTSFAQYSVWVSSMLLHVVVVHLQYYSTLPCVTVQAPLSCRCILCSFLSPTVMNTAAVVMPVHLWHMAVQISVRTESLHHTVWPVWSASMDTASFPK